jgi:hypothetical protein
MNNIIDYAKTRNVAIILTIVILVLGSIIYFSTNIAERNNKMMYERIYGRNMISNIANKINGSNAINNDAVVEAKEIKTALV